MTMQGWTLILVFTAHHHRAGQADGHVAFRALRRPADAAASRARAGRARLLPACRDRSRRRAELAPLCACTCCCSSWCCCCSLMRSCACRHVLPMNPRGLAGLRRGRRVEHRGQLHHQHQLAMVFGRSRAVEPQPDAGPDDPQLPLGRHRHCHRLRPVPRLCAARERRPIGNFWADCTRVTLYLLLPICVVYALFLIASGVPQTFASVGRCDHAGRRQADHRARAGRQPGSDQDARHQWRRLLQRQFRPSVREPDRADQSRPDAVDLRDRRRADLVLRQGGGQHPPGLGDPRGDDGAVPRRRQHRLLAGSRRQSDAAPASASPAATWRARKSASASPPARCSRSITTAASCGAVNAMHDSFTALGGMIPLFNMQLGEIVVGGVGAGIYGFLLFAMLAVFVAGLMVGRTPEYVGKKIEAREVKLAVLAIAVLPLCILGLTAISAVLPAGLAGPLNKGPHGFTRDPLCLQLGHRQQRLGLRRPDRRHAVLQRPARRRDVDRPVLRDRAGAGHRRQPGGQEVHAGNRRLIPDHRAAVGRPAGRRSS